MKKITSWLLAITFLANIAFISSCKKDDDDPVLPEIEGIEFTDNTGLIYLSWDIVENAEVYMVSVNGIDESSVPFLLPEWYFENLAKGSEVTISAFSDFTMEHLIAATTVEYAGSTASAEVKNIRFEDVGLDVIVSWDAVIDAQCYMVFTGGVPDTDNPITTTSYNAGSLMDGLEVKVEAYSDMSMQNKIAEGEENYSSQQVGTIKNITIVTDGLNVVVNWDAYLGAAGYMIKRNGINLLSSTISYTSYTISIPNQGDVIRVEAFSDNYGSNMIAYGETIYSVTEEPPAPVSGLYVREVYDDEVDLGWNESGIDNFTHIEIYLGERVEGSTSNFIKTVDKGYEYTYITGCEPGTTYEFYVYAVNENNSVQKYSTPSVISVTTLEGGLTSLDETEWYSPGNSIDPEMTLWFNATTVDFEEGGYFHEDLPYTYNSSTRKGVIDPDGYFNGEIEVSEDGQTLTYFGDIVFTRTFK